MGLALLFSKIPEEILEHTLLQKTSVQIPKLLKKINSFFFLLLWNSCTKRYRVSKSIWTHPVLKKEPYSTYSCEYFHEMYFPLWLPS